VLLRLPDTQARPWPLSEADIRRVRRVPHSEPDVQVQVDWETRMIIP
jgi:hypothetical protein